MAGLKSLAKETVIYGASSIIGRFLNYLLVPLYTAKLSVSSGGYGVITNIYSITALLLIILTYGMETGFFRFANKKDENPQTVYTTTLLSVGATSLLFIFFVTVLLNPISQVLGYADHTDYVMIMSIVVALDAFQCIPFAYLRYQKRPIKFASIKLLFIIPNILINLFFYITCPWLMQHAPDTISWFYNPNYGVGYAFVANLICTSGQLLFFTHEIFGFKYSFDKQLWKKMISYSLPMLILGISGILNQTVDKIMFPFFFADKMAAKVQLGIYGAASKIALIMAMFTQAFRYAYEPFVFGKTKDENNKNIYARAMKFFIIFSLIAFLIIMLYLDVIKHVVARGYWEGLKCVPIVMAASILTGIYFNLSFWYKLIDETRWGAYFSCIGCVSIVALNALFVPTYGYMACAWAGLAGYLLVTLLSYFVGQKKYPINYDLIGIGKYTLLTIILYGVNLMVDQFAPIKNFALRFLFHTVLLLIFLTYVEKHDFPLKEIPLLRKFVKKEKHKR